MAIDGKLEGPVDGPLLGEQRVWMVGRVWWDKALGQGWWVRREVVAGQGNVGWLWKGGGKEPMLTDDT